MIRILSYIFPFRVKQYISKYSGKLDVAYINGKKILDTDNSNYSYGSLQRILHKGLLEINFDSHTHSILVLGLGGGSIIETIRKDFKSDAFIELVEIDSTIIEVAKKEFGVDKYKNINIIHADAKDYLLTEKKKFDLIIVDIFIGNEIPEAFSQTDVLQKITGLLSEKGSIIYNTMRTTIPKNSLLNIVNVFSNSGLDVQLKEKIESSNDLIIARKK